MASATKSATSQQNVEGGDRQQRRRPTSSSADEQSKRKQESEGEARTSSVSTQEDAEQRFWERAVTRLEDEVIPHTHIVAVDGSTDSHRAFVWACNSLPRQDSLLVVNGMQVHDRSPELDWMEPVDWTKSADETSNRLLKGYDGLCRAAGRQCSFESIEYRNNTDLARRICSLAEAREAATVICGSRGSNNLDRMMLGSVSSGLVNRCRCSVLVARNIGLAPRASVADRSSSSSSSRSKAQPPPRDEFREEMVRGEVPIVM